MCYDVKTSGRKEAEGDKMDLQAVTDSLERALSRLHFAAPVAHVYNPLIYAREPYSAYLQQYGVGQREVVLLGMNPGPWGMVQTGVPFGEIAAVRDWLGIAGRVDKPQFEHPKRPVLGFECTRSEVSGRRVWGWARNEFDTPEAFFTRFFVANYCPLAFLEESGRNRTPDKLPRRERDPLMAACDEALAATIEYLQPRYVVGLGRFTEQSARRALEGKDLTIGVLPHPSPANPVANRGWERLASEGLRQVGIAVP